MKPGDLVQDTQDDEIGLVISVGPGYETGDYVEYPDGTMPSWKIKWPSISYVCDLGEDALAEGIVRIISKA